MISTPETIKFWFFKTSHEDFQAMVAHNNDRCHGRRLGRYKTQEEAQTSVVNENLRESHPQRYFAQRGRKNV
jgi:hypothetical protein